MAIGTILFSMYVCKFDKNINKVLLFAILFAILWVTIFAKKVTVREINLTPLWSFRRIGDAFLTCEIVLNIALFIPFGALLYVNMKNRSIIWTIAIGCIISIIVETVQFIYALGLCETDDAISNTLGTLIGCVRCYLAIEKSEET